MDFLSPSSRAWGGVVSWRVAAAQGPWALLHLASSHVAERNWPAVMRALLWTDGARGGAMPSSVAASAIAQVPSWVVRGRAAGVF